MRILVVEDDPKLGALLRQGLREHGFAVDLAGDGATGLQLALSSEYDAMILDVLLPRQNGFEVVRDLRRAECPLPVLILTSRSSVEDRVHGLNLGADDYLAKP